LRRLDDEHKRLLDSLIDEKTRSRLERCRSGLIAIKSELAALPPPQLVYAASHDFAPEGSFKPANPIRPVYLLARGDVKRPKDLMSPGAPAVFSNLSSAFDLSDSDNEGNRRVALAKWLTHTNNLLTRRSIVNRVWQYHFGRGLTDTPNDFGHMGSLPSAPELLDSL